MIAFSEPAGLLVRPGRRGSTNLPGQFEEAAYGEVRQVRGHTIVEHPSDPRAVGSHDEDP